MSIGIDTVQQLKLYRYLMTSCSQLIVCMNNCISEHPILLTTCKRKIDKSGLFNLFYKAMIQVVMCKHKD